MVGNMRFSSNHRSSSQVRQDSSRQEAQSDQSTTDQSSSPLLKLLHLTKNTCVVYGRQSNESVEESSWKRIILDEIVDGNVDLINGRGKLEDLIPGDTLDWPEFRIISI